LTSISTMKTTTTTEDMPPCCWVLSSPVSRLFHPMQHFIARLGSFRFHATEYSVLVLAVPAARCEVFAAGRHASNTRSDWEADTARAHQNLVFGKSFFIRGTIMQISVLTWGRPQLMRPALAPRFANTPRDRDRQPAATPATSAEARRMSWERSRCRGVREACTWSAENTCASQGQA
jgi:hypothetical protein